MGRPKSTKLFCSAFTESTATTGRFPAILCRIICPSALAISAWMIKIIGASSGSARESASAATAASFFNSW